MPLSIADSSHNTCCFPSRSEMMDKAKAVGMECMTMNSGSQYVQAFVKERDPSKVQEIILDIALETETQNCVSRP